MTSVLKYTQGKSLCLPTAPDSVRGFMQDLPLSWQTEGLMLKKGSRSTVKLVTSRTAILRCQNLQKNAPT